MLFPERFNNAQTLQYWTTFKSRLLARLKLLITKDEEYIKRIEQADRYFLRLLAPKNLDGMSPQNVIVQTRKEFENLCVILIDRGVPDPQRMTIFRFYSTIKFYEEQKDKPRKK